MIEEVASILQGWFLTFVTQHLTFCNNQICEKKTCLLRLKSRWSTVPRQHT